MTLIITCQFESASAAHNATRALCAFGLKADDLILTVRELATDDKAPLASSKQATVLKHERGRPVAPGFVLAGLVALTALIGGAAALGCVFVFGMPWQVAILGATLGAAIGWSTRAAVLPTGARVSMPVRTDSCDADAREANRHTELSVHAGLRDQADLIDILQAYGALEMTISQRR